MRIEERMEEYQEEILEMANRVRKSMDMAIQALISGDKELALEVIERDDHINYADESINDSAVEILSLMQPVAKDLRWLIGGIKIASDLERIGDYSKNIGRFVIKNDYLDTPYDAEIEEIGNIFLENFDAVVDVLKSQDVKQAYIAAEMDDRLDDAFKRIMNRFADDVDAAHRFPLATTGILRNIERAGDHSKNICEQVIYIVKGQHIDFG